VQRVRFIKRAQQLGFSLKEVAELSSLTGGCRKAGQGSACPIIEVLAGG